MFDIGFWEIVVVAVVALLVVGPDEFPTLVRNIGGWLGKIRRFVSETREELELFRSYGCRLVQGFYISRPLAADRMPRAVEKGFGFSASTGKGSSAAV